MRRFGFTAVSPSHTVLVSFVAVCRYMDSKDDEQARGITMKSSSISLLFVPGAASRAEGPNSVSHEERLEKGGCIFRWQAAVGGSAGEGLLGQGGVLVLCCAGRGCRLLTAVESA
jgi:hypothetical protein